MKKFLFLLTISLVSSIHAQEITVEAQKFPYYDILEWKGKGAILMSKDPNESTRLISLTMVSDQQETLWDETFTPRNKEFYFITSENARYVYFLGNLELDEMLRVHFTQITSSGNKKATNVSLKNTLKGLGVTNYSDLEVVNIVVTDKALVHHFRYKDKKTKSTVELATFIAHHNFLSYGVELGKVFDEDLKKEDYGLWDYVGFTGEKICFAARGVQEKKAGWTVKEYSYKGKQLSNAFFDAPAEFVSIEKIGFGSTGKYFLKGQSSMEKGILCFINNKYYMIGGERKDNGARLILYEYIEDEWMELNHMKLNYFIEKKSLKLGIYPMNEGIGYHLDHNGYNKASIITFKSGEQSAHNSFTERTIYNPSSVFNRKEKHEFSVTLEEGELIFDTNQLNKPGSVKFTLKK